MIVAERCGRNNKRTLNREQPGASGDSRSQRGDEGCENSRNPSTRSSLLLISFRNFRFLGSVRLTAFDWQAENLPHGSANLGLFRWMGRASNSSVTSMVLLWACLNLFREQEACHVVCRQAARPRGLCASNQAVCAQFLRSDRPLSLYAESEIGRAHV